MKRIAFVAAAALLGTGCVSESSPLPPGPVGSVDLYWSFQRFAPAQVSGRLDYDATYEWVGHANTYCPDSSVESVTVTSPVGEVTVPCVYANGVQGLGIDNLPAGTQPFRLRGWRGAYVVYDSGTVYLDVHEGMSMPYYRALQGVSAPLDMFAYLVFGVPATEYPSCAAAGSPNLGFEVRDVWGTLVDDGLVGCSDPLPATVFVGDLDLDNYDVRMRGYELGSGAVVFDSCAVALDHFGSQIGASGFAPVLYTFPLPACL